MGAVRIWLIAFPVCLVCCLAPGWFNPISAAAGKVKAGPASTAGRAETPPEECPLGATPEPSPAECPSTFGPIITDTAIPIEKGMFSIQSTMGPGVVTNNFSPSWRRISAGGNFTTFGVDLKLSYGLWDNLEVSAGVPYIHNWAGQVNEPGPRGDGPPTSGESATSTSALNTGCWPKARWRPRSALISWWISPPVIFAT